MNSPGNERQVQDDAWSATSHAEQSEIADVNSSLELDHRIGDWVRRGTPEPRLVLLAGSVAQRISFYHRRRQRILVSAGIAAGACVLVLSFIVWTEGNGSSPMNAPPSAVGESPAAEWAALEWAAQVPETGDARADIDSVVFALAALPPTPPVDHLEIVQRDQQQWEFELILWNGGR